MKRSIPGTISPEAQQFYEDAEPLVRASLDKVPQIRDDDHAEAQRTNPPIASEHTDAVETLEISGVSVMVVTPKNYDTANDNRAILYFFGGAFVVGSPDVDFPIIAPLASHTGVKVYAPYYRRAPEHPCPAAIDDAVNVYEAMQETVDHIAVAGESAGGNLSLSMALRAHDDGLELPAALALMSPWCDVTRSTDSQQQPAGFDPTLDYDCHLAEPAAAYAGELDQRDPRVSPLYADYPAAFPATLITTGTRELFLSDCARLSTKMRAAGIDARLHVWEGMWHTFEWYHDIPEASESIREIASFLLDKLSSDDT